MRPLNLNLFLNLNPRQPEIKKEIKITIKTYPQLYGTFSHTRWRCRAGVPSSSQMAAVRAGR
jgi:hypothetical protein